MADLDADLQGPGNGLFSSMAVGIHVHYDADQQIPLVGAYESENSYCTCVAGAATIHTTGITAFADHLDVTFSDNVVLSGPALDVANWYVTHSDAGRDVTVTSIVSVTTNTVRLSVTPQTLNTHYTLHLPLTGITSDDFGIFTGLFSLDFLGVPTIVAIQMLKVIDTHTVHVIFGVAVDEDDASDPLNYSVDGGLTIVSATKITDFWYELKNKPRQVDGVTYNFTATNIGPK